MTARQSTPSSDHSHSDNGVRKRVCKACDRCRLKKSKCDGAKPCGRCRADNALCVFGERKKAHDKVYPKGYVEMLEQQQTWLVNGLQELYRRLLDGEGWQGEPLKCEPNGHPLTHDLLTHLGALDQSKHERFEESADALQQELWKHSAGHMQRQESLDTSSDSAHSPVVPQFAPDPLAARTLPQTPPTINPPTSLRIDVPPRPAIKNEHHRTPSNGFITSMQQPIPLPCVVNPSELQSAQLQNPQWTNPGSFGGYDDMDLMSAQYSGLPFESLDDNGASPMFSRQMALGCVIPGPYMDNKNDFDDINQFLNTQLEITS
ncbi:Zn(II)2Cys6 transcription factor domain-containing protein [Aspergillus lucknowensis]|uniref:Zn(2)-C6 fungal-type domain-containing protein n=1 Tax=Aspergillus lucknowensis TaxID=176173 RepID=A0ABR4LEI0_9EURO